MIFYFSGTGNSLHVAKTIAQRQNEELIFIPKEFEDKDNDFHYNIKKDEIMALVFPVYAWGPPEMVTIFIEKLQISGEKPYLTLILTCGQDEGETTHLVKELLEEKGLKLDSAFTLTMPNNYIIGADVDSPEEITQKLERADQKLIEINATLKNKVKGVFHTKPGTMAALKSKLVNPFFTSQARGTRKFFATDACTRCGLCVEVCPVHTITLEDKPVWGNECTRCLACLNRCPEEAIQYGKGTKNRGRYVHPDLLNANYLRNDKS